MEIGGRRKERGHERVMDRGGKRRDESGERRVRLSVYLSPMARCFFDPNAADAPAAVKEALAHQKATASDRRVV